MFSLGLQGNNIQKPKTHNLIQHSLHTSGTLKNVYGHSKMNAYEDPVYIACNLKHFWQVCGCGWFMVDSHFVWHVHAVVSFVLGETHNLRNLILPLRTVTIREQPQHGVLSTKKGFLVGLLMIIDGLNSIRNSPTLFS